MRDFGEKMRNRFFKGAASLAIAIVPCFAISVAASEPILVGDLREIDAGELPRVVRMSELSSRDGVYGLGMIEGMAGEVFVWNSQAWIGETTGGEHAVRPVRGDEWVVFGAYGAPGGWRTVPVPDSVRSFRDLETFIARSLDAAGHALDRPTLFRIEGRARSLHWFVVDGMGSGKPDPRSSFQRGIRRGVLEDVSFDAIGVHSQAHRSVLTNPRSDIHLHFRTAVDGGWVAHLDDDILIEPGAVLRIPEDRP